MPRADRPYIILKMPSEHTAVLGSVPDRKPAYGGPPQNTSRLILFHFPSSLVVPTESERENLEEVEFQDRMNAAERADLVAGMVVAIEAGGLLDILAHPNEQKYPRQRVLVVAYEAYAYLLPFVEWDDYFFLKTVIPSRKATRDYLNQGDEDARQD